MTQRNGTLTAMAVGLALAGGSLCYGQAQQPAVRDTLPAGQGQTVDRAGASDRAGQAQPAAAQQAASAHADHAAMATGGKQVDMQVDQQLQKIQQSREMAADKLFVLEAGLGGQFEMALAQQALTKSQDQQVKQVAQTIIRDHDQANQQLMQVAQKVQVELPKGLTSMKQQKLQIIGSLDSKMYDQKFLACMDALHAHDVAEFRNTAQLAQSPDVKQFASATLPKLQEHHQQIKQAGTAAGLPAGTDAMPASGRVPAQQSQQGVTPRSDGGNTAPENRPNAARPPVGSNTPNTPNDPK